MSKEPIEPFCTAADTYRRVFGRAFYRLAIWGLGGYMAYMLLGSAILTAVGFQLPK